MRENQNIPARPALSPRTQRNNLESNEENVDIIPPTPMRSARSSLHADDVVLTRIVPCESNTNDDISRSSQIRSHDIDIGGISSIHPVDRGIESGVRQLVLDDRGSSPSYQCEGIHLPRTSTMNRRDSSDSSDTDRFYRGRGYSNERGRPPGRERGTQVEIEGLPEEEDYRVVEDPQTDLLENHLVEEDHLIEENHLIEEDCLVEEDHLMMEDPLMMEDNLMEMEDPQDIQIEEEPQDQEDPLDQ